MRRKIKLKIAGFKQDDPTSYGHFFYNALTKFYDIELSDTPDYLIYNEATSEYLEHDCIRIFYTAENIHANFNLCDYALTFDYLEFGDRHFRLPFYLLMQFTVPVPPLSPSTIPQDQDFTRQRTYTHEDLKKKTGFCSFVYSNYRGDPNRQFFFNLLSRTYKQVSAGGRYLNNVGGQVPSKLEFESKHKFSIAFENSSRSGYTTEKLTNAILAGTIPIYWGNPDIGKEFNTKRFINCHDYESFEQVVERIKEIDTDDMLYLDIINTPFTIPEYDSKEVERQSEEFLRHIIDQPLDSAKRRLINPVRKMSMEHDMKIISKYHYLKQMAWSVVARLYSPFKRFTVIEKVKHQLRTSGKRKK